MLIHSAKFSNIIALLKDDEDSRALLIGMIESIEAIEDEEKKSFRIASLNMDQPIAVYQHRRATSQLSHTDFENLRTLRHGRDLPCHSNQISIIEEVSLRGVRYGAFSSRQFRDSSVIFQFQDRQATGVIEKIFGFTSWGFGTGTQGVDLYVIIQEHLPIASQGEDDPYLAFGHAAGYLCEKTSRRRNLIPLVDIISHFVLTPIPDTQYIHVLPVDKVSILICITDKTSHHQSSATSHG